MRVRSVLLASLAILLPLLLFRSIHFSASFGLSDAAAWLDGERRLDQHATVRILDDDVHAPVPATAPPVTAPPTMTASPPPPGASTAAPTTAAATNASLHNATLAAMARSNLVYNRPGYALLGALEPARVGTTLHFTFGSIVMRDFVRNWMHFIRKAKLAPALVGCADASLRASSRRRASRRWECSPSSTCGRTRGRRGRRRRSSTSSPTGSTTATTSRPSSRWDS